MNNNKGFTLVELLIVIAIVGVIASMAVPAFSGMMERNRLKSALQAVQDDLQSTRMLAVKQSQNVSLYVKRTSTTAGDWCYGLSTKAACNCTVTDTTAATYCEIKIISGTGFNTTSADIADATITFDFRRGTIPAAVEIPFHTTHYKSSVSVDTAGRVKICAPASMGGLTALPTVPNC